MLCSQSGGLWEVVAHSLRKSRSKTYAMSVMPHGKRPEPTGNASDRPAENRQGLERRIQGLANASFLRVHEAAAKVIESPAPAVEMVPPPVETPASQAAKARSRVAERLARLAEKTASRTREATSQAMAASRTGIATAAKLGRERVLPGLKERTRPERIAADYRAFQIWLHKNLLDSTIERLLFVPTAGHTSLDGLTIRGPNRAYGRDYRPVPYWVFKWALSAVDDDPTRLRFVDYGAGKGRALLLASMYPFRAIDGIEFAEELHDNATMNIAQFSRSHMKCRNVECMLEDAVNAKIPDDEAIHYFFNPFAPELFAEVLRGIVASYHTKPRRLYLILIDMDVADMVRATGVFQEVQLPPSEGLMARFLSPHGISVFRSLA